MRVTKAVREYVRKAVLAKVEDRIKKAEDAKAKAVAERDAKIEKACEIAEKIAATAQEAFVKRVTKLGLTWVPYTYYGGTVNKEGGNCAFTTCVNRDDFAETMPSGHGAYAVVKSVERDRVEKVCKEPGRIRKAAETVADKLLFELELGKIAKKGFDEALRNMEVEI